MKNKVMKKVLMIMLSATMLIGSASVTAFAQANENAEQAETAGGAACHRGNTIFHAGKRTTCG